MKAIRLLLVLVCSVVATALGLAGSYQSFVTPLSSYGHFQRIHGDKWLEDGAVISFSHLASWGNRLRFETGEWFPPGLPPAHLRVKVCGQDRTEFLAVPGTVHFIDLSGPCEPRTVEFTVVNPFQAGPSDSRLLGAQLESVTVTSPFKVPLFRASTFLPVVTAIFVLTLLVGSLLPRSGALLSTALVPALGGSVLAMTEHLDLVAPFGLWLFLLSFCFGAFILADLPQRKLIREEDNSVIQRACRENGHVLSLLTLTGILLLGFILRFTGLDFGLPDNFHPDEVPKYNAIMGMVRAGDLNPRYFLHPSLLLYSTYFMNSSLHWLGMPGEWNETLIFSGRLVSLTAGVLSIYLVYCIGARLFDRFAGLLAAAFLAVSPLHVTSSRYVKEDSLLVFFILLTLLTVLKAVQEDRRWFLLLAGFLGGCSAGVKYSGLLSGCIIVAAPWLRSKRLIPDKAYLYWTLGALAIFPLGFLACTPYSVLDSQKFLHDFRLERNHMHRGHTTSIDPWSQLWMYHFIRSIVPGTTMLVSVLGVMGLGILAWRRKMTDLYLLSVFLLFYLPAEFVNAKPAPQPERYILPCLPVLALAAGEVLRVISRLRIRVMLPGLMALFLIVPLVRTAQLAAEVQDDTRLRMQRWIVENLSPGSTVFIGWKPYGPPLEGTQIDVHYIPRDKILPSLNVDELKSSGIDYLVLSSLYYDRFLNQPNAIPIQREQVRNVFRSLPIVKQIAPRYGTYGFHNPTLTLFDLRTDRNAKG